MLQHTPLYSAHVASNAKLVDFAGWEMPLHYGSQIEEHHAVRQSAGLFDVSHMAVVDIQGEAVAEWLRYLLANDVRKLTQFGQALYSCMLSEKGGVIDDLIVYRFDEHHYRLVVNAGTRQKDLAWLKKQASSSITITERKDLAILALQGPHAMNVISQIFPEHAANLSALKPFKFMIVEGVQIARTGYTGENGFEIIIPNNQALVFWDQLMGAGVKPCGLGARDTLRLEAGFNLYGTDMDENISPLVANLAWTIDWSDENRDFIGKKALLLEKNHGVTQEFVGLIMETPGVLRNHQIVYYNAAPVGEITSGGFSPTLGHAVALARVSLPIPAALTVERRGEYIPVKLVTPQFVRQGKKIYKEQHQ